MIIVFIGPPYAGKGTQTALLKNKLGMKVFSMGALIREAREKGDRVIEEAYKNYAMKGLNVPTEIKFRLLEIEMDKAKGNFILDNFPATEDDLKIFLEYLKKRNLSVDKAIHLSIGEEEMVKRLSKISRGRADDDPQIVKTRREIQEEDRKPVLEYFRDLGILRDINGEGDIEEVNRKIEEEINKV